MITRQHQLQTAKDIDAANRQHGFVCLRNSGISKAQVQSAFDASKHLFQLDEPVKREQLKQIDPQTNTEYVCGEALNRKRQTDLKEAFNVRNTSVQNGDFVGTPESFQKVTTKFWDALKDLAPGLEEDYFSKTLDIMDLCTLRMLHYPPCGSNAVIHDVSQGPDDAACAIRVGEHTDFGIFTFLFINDFQDKSSLGLQVKDPHGGENGWNDVVFDAKSLQTIENDETCAIIVNIGALMARWTNDVWTATAHRVIVSPNAFSSHRYSIAMFFDPDKEVLCSVHPNFVPSGEKPKYPDIKSLDFLLMKLREAQGVKA